jgi:hypothetical protein
MTLQEHYNAIKNGKGNKDQFLKQARQLFPQYLNQYSDFNTATNVLKSKQIISENIAGGVVTKGFDIFDWKKILAEEAKAEEKETSKEVKDAQKYAYDNTDMKNADNINFNEIMKGFYAELKDPKNHDKTSEEIKAMVVKNLAKDPLFYTKDGEFGVKGVGYTTEAPGLGTPKEPKGKHKSSGYGDIEKEVKVKANVQDSLGDKEAKTSDPKKVKEMTTTPQNSAGVKKMKMPGAEKKIKLKESIDEIGMFHDPMGYSSSKDSEDKQAVKDVLDLIANGTSEEEAIEQTAEKYGLYSSYLTKKYNFLKDKLEEAMVQGPIVNPKGGGGGKQKAPRAVFLSKEVVDQINDKFPGSIKLLSKGKEASMFISQLFAIALGALSRGRYSPDTERKKPELAKFVADVIPTLIRGKIKKELVAKPTDIAGSQMHYVKLKLVPKNDGTGYWIPLMGEFDPLMTEAEQKLRSIISQIIKESEESEEDDDLFNTREEAEELAMDLSRFKKNEIYYVEEENGKYKAVESMYDEPPRGVYFQNGNRKGGSYMPSPGNDPENVDESKLVSLIRTMVRESLNEGANDWDTLFNWLKQFSTDKGEFLSKNNISSGIFLEKKLTSGEVKVEDLDKIAKKDGTVFSKLPVYNRIK